MMTIDVYSAMVGKYKDVSLQRRALLGLLGNRSYQLVRCEGTGSTGPSSPGSCQAVVLRHDGVRIGFGASWACALVTKKRGGW